MEGRGEGKREGKRIEIHSKMDSWVSSMLFVFYFLLMFFDYFFCLAIFFCFSFSPFPPSDPKLLKSPLKKFRKVNTENREKDPKKKSKAWRTIAVRPHKRGAVGGGGLEDILSGGNRSDMHHRPSSPASNPFASLSSPPFTACESLTPRRESGKEGSPKSPKVMKREEGEGLKRSAKDMILKSPKSTRREDPPKSPIGTKREEGMSKSPMRSGKDGTPKSPKSLKREVGPRSPKITKRDEGLKRSGRDGTPRSPKSVKRDEGRSKSPKNAREESSPRRRKGRKEGKSPRGEETKEVVATKD